MAKIQNQDPDDGDSLFTDEEKAQLKAGKPRPDNELPETDRPGKPARPDNELPEPGDGGDKPEPKTLPHPDNTLPGQGRTGRPPHVDNSLPKRCTVINPFRDAGAWDTAHEPGDEIEVTAERYERLKGLGLVE